MAMQDINVFVNQDISEANVKVSILYHVISSEISEKCIQYKGQWNEKQKILHCRNTSKI